MNVFLFATAEYMFVSVTSQHIDFKKFYVALAYKLRSLIRLLFMSIEMVAAIPPTMAVSIRVDVRQAASYKNISRN